MRDSHPIDQRPSSGAAAVTGKPTVIGVVNIRSVPVSPRIAFLAVLTGCGAPQQKAITPNDGGIVVRATASELRKLEIAPPWRIALSGRGTVFVGSRLSDGLVVEIDTSTGVVVKTIGRRGSGPGEYTDVGMISTFGDSLWLQHPGSGRTQVYDQNGQYVREFSSEIPVQVGGLLRLRGDSLLVAEPHQSPEAFGLPLHLLTPSGQRVRSFGSDDRTITPGRFVPRLRILTSETDSSFWVARRDRYQIELWNTAGKLERSHTLSRDWFPEMVTDPGNPSISRPVSQLAGIHRDAHGHLIVVLLRAHPGWQSRAREPGASSTVSHPFETLGHFEVVIEVLDPVSGALVDSSVVPQVRTAGEFVRDGVLVGYAESSDGGLTFALYTISH